MVTALQPGTVEKTTTFKTVIPAEEANQKGKRTQRPPIWDFLPSISLQDWKSGHYQIYLYRYNPLTEKKMALEKFNEALDPFSIKSRFGGGSFNIMVKEGPELIYDQDFDIEGDPITAGTSRTTQTEASAGSDAVAIQAMRMMSNPDMMKGMFEMYAMAAKQSMEMIRAQMPAQTNPLETLRTAKEILGPPASPEGGLLDTIRVLKELGIIGSSEKKGITEILEIVNTLKGSGLLAAPAKADLASTFVASLPSLLDRAVTGLHEVRLHSEATERAMRLQRGEIKPDDPNVITVESPAPQTAATATAPAPATHQPQTLTPEVTQQVIMQADLRRLVNAIKDPECTGQDIYTFLSCVWPELLAEMVKFKKDDLLMFFRSREMQMAQLHNAILLEVGNDPRLPKMIEEFLAIAKADAAPPGATV